MFYGVYGSKANKETINTLMYDMSLDQFLEHKTFVEVQSSFELAAHKDQEVAIKAAEKKNGK